MNILSAHRLKSWCHFPNVFELWRWTNQRLSRNGKSIGLQMRMHHTIFFPIFSTPVIIGYRHCLHFFSIHLLHAPRSTEREVIRISHETKRQAAQCTPYWDDTMASAISLSELSILHSHWRLIPIRIDKQNVIASMTTSKKNNNKQ